MISLRFAFGASTPCLIVVSGQKRWIFLPGIGSPGRAGNNGIQVFSFCNIEGRDFEIVLYVAMRENGKIERERRAVRRLASFI